MTDTAEWWRLTNRWDVNKRCDNVVRGIIFSLVLGWAADWLGWWSFYARSRTERTVLIPAVWCASLKVLCKKNRVLTVRTAGTLFWEGSLTVPQPVFQFFCSCGSKAHLFEQTEIPVRSRTGLMISRELETNVSQIHGHWKWLWALIHSRCRESQRLKATIWLEEVSVSTRFLSWRVHVVPVTGVRSTITQ